MDLGNFGKPLRVTLQKSNRDVIRNLNTNQNVVKWQDQFNLWKYSWGERSLPESPPSSESKGSDVREHQDWVIQNQSKTIKRMFKLCSSDNIAELRCKRVCDTHFSLWRTTGIEQLQTVFTVKKRNPNWTASTAVHFLVNDLQLVI